MRHVRCELGVCRLGHQFQRLRDLAFGKYIQKWRLVQRKSEACLQGVVEDCVLGAVGEVGNDDAVFL